MFDNELDKVGDSATLDSYDLIKAQNKISVTVLKSQA